MTHVAVARVGPDSTEQVLAVIREAFAARPILDPPADAAGETAETLRHRLEQDGGLLASVDGEPAGALVFDREGASMHLRRFGVVPAAQGRGVALALVEVAARMAADLGCESLTVTAREELPATIRFWEAQGFREVERQPPSLELRRPVRGGTYDVPDAAAMQALGRRVAGWLHAGDLVVLSGDLGAGKTTFTQGLGAGLDVRAPITSPTFVIARVHPSEVPGGQGPALVHADAYRLGSTLELDDLDLDADLDRAVTVVEWGEGIAEGLAESRIEVRIDRSDETESRRVEIISVGPRWQARV